MGDAAEALFLNCKLAGFGKSGRCGARFFWVRLRTGKGVKVGALRFAEHTLQFPDIHVATGNNDQM